MGKRVLIVGCGYVGLPLGQELSRRGHTVFGLRRSTVGDAELDTAGITPLRADITRPETLAKLPHDFDWVVNCAATSGGTAEDYRRLYLDGNVNLVNWLRATPPQKYLFTSSTSVYGQNDGSLVTEISPTTPEAGTANELVAAESLLLRAAKDSQFPTLVLRLAGIYGPDRGYWLKQFLKGEAQLDGDGSRFLNMIQVEDVVGAIVSALEKAAAGSIYNVSDDEPVSQHDLLAWLAEKLKRPMPGTSAGESIRKRGATNKRVSNRRLREELGYRLKYPTFREGFTRELERLRL